MIRISVQKQSLCISLVLVAHLSTVYTGGEHFQFNINIIILLEGKDITHNSEHANSHIDAQCYRYPER